MSDPSDLAWWYPRLTDTGVVTPATTILATPADGVPEVGAEAPAGYPAFLESVRLTIEQQFGWPVFLRTGRWAVKRRWPWTCWLTSPDNLDMHLRRFATWSKRRGLPMQSVAIREPLTISAYCTAYGGAPIGREFRCYFTDGVPRCMHSLWTPADISRGMPQPADWLPRFAAAQESGVEESRLLATLTGHVARCFAKHMTGAWMIDWAMLADGRWAAIDMEVERLTRHPAGCRDLVESINANAATDTPLLWQLTRNVDGGDDELPRTFSDAATNGPDLEGAARADEPGPGGDGKSPGAAGVGTTH